MSVCLSICISAYLIVVCPVFPGIHNTSTYPREGMHPNEDHVVTTWATPKTTAVIAVREFGHAT